MLRIAINNNNTQNKHKPNMKAKFLAPAIVAALAGMLALVSCSNKANGAASAFGGPEFQGTWVIKNIVAEDGQSVNPAGENPPIEATITFENGAYRIATGCNAVQGSYTLGKNGALTMHDGLSTKMACPNMKVEDMACRVLPLIKWAQYENPRALRLTTGTKAYIALTR